jgi:hypothetical protein
MPEFDGALGFRSTASDARDFFLMCIAQSFSLVDSTHVSPRAGMLVRVRGHGREPLKPKGHPGYD